MVLRLVLPAFAGVERRDGRDGPRGGARDAARRPEPWASRSSTAPSKVFRPPSASGLGACVRLWSLVRRRRRHISPGSRPSSTSLRGDPDAGQELFLSTKVGCFGCHRAVGRGGTVGPDLSRIGKIRSRAELLESIVFPGLTVAPEYRTVLVATRDGRVTTGLVVRDTPESVTCGRPTCRRSASRARTSRR